MISVVVLALVFILLITRQIGNFKLQIWQIMTLGALTVLMLGEISLKEAINVIDWEVILFLFSMFIIGVTLERSGYLAHLTYNFFKKAKTVEELFLYMLFVFGISSAVFMNDTIAIIGTPVVILISKKYKINLKMLLITLAFAVTIGSVFSPIGNPQNFIVATQAGIKNPFLIFIKYLFVPTIINLFLTFFIIKMTFGSHFLEGELKHSQEPIKNRSLAVLAKVSIYLLLILVSLKIIVAVLRPDIEIRLVFITLIAALPILIFSNQRIKILKRVDWSTLLFFASMFVLMGSVWKSGFFQRILFSLKINFTSLFSIMGISVVLSQLISNVPLVMLYLPMLKNLAVTTKQFMALAASSTIAGNLTILGAASNIIIIHTAERKLKTHHILSFFEFFKIGIVVTTVNVLVYLIYLYIIP